VLITEALTRLQSGPGSRGTLDHVWVHPYRTAGGNCRHRGIDRAAHSRSSESPGGGAAVTDAESAPSRQRICTAFNSFFKKFGVYPADLNDVRLLEFTPNNEPFDQLSKNLGFQCFLYKLISTGTPGIQSGWNFSLCTIFHDGVTEYCIDKNCQLVTTTTSKTQDKCPQ
jgi:hypothetical protein